MMDLLQSWSDSVSENHEDIRRVLALCFRSGEKQTASEIERILSFDMGWMDTDTAFDAVRALVKSGWIKEEQGFLTSNCRIKGIIAPLGWQPRPSRLLHPVVFELESEEIKSAVVQPSKELVKQEPDVEGLETKVIDPRARVEKRLVKYISKQTDIPQDEIIRRAERKIGALKYCTMWLALCLISREQGLEMNSIINSFTSN